MLYFANYIMLRSLERQWKAKIVLQKNINFAVMTADLKRSAKAVPLSVYYVMQNSFRHNITHNKT